MKQSNIKKIKYSENEWKKQLTPEQFCVMRQKGTERPFTGKLLDVKDDGTFICAACGNPIFESNNKFDSHCGWPSFDEAIVDSIELIPDVSNGMRRTEVICAKCDGHLGHVFDDGPTGTGKRYCINSVCMDFIKSK